MLKLLCFLFSRDWRCCGVDDYNDWTGTPKSSFGEKVLMAYSAHQTARVRKRLIPATISRPAFIPVIPFPRPRSITAIAGRKSIIIITVRREASTGERKFSLFPILVVGSRRRGKGATPDANNTNISTANTVPLPQLPLPSPLPVVEAKILLFA